MKKIAIVAKMQRGKTTVANYLVTKHGFVKISIADKIKLIVKELQPDLFGYDIENNELKPRIELQMFGQVTKEVLGREVWINYALRQIESAIGSHPKPKGIVVDDVRFIFEAKALRKAGFVIVKIKGKNQTGQRLGSDHISEKSIDKIKTDLTICNRGSLATLYSIIDDMVDNLKNV